MDPIFASVLLGFFALIVALVAITIAIAYRQNEIAQEAIRNSRKLYNPNNTSVSGNTDVQESLQES